MKSIKSVCSACQECCKKYNITLLPEEAKRIQKKLNLSEKEFIEKNCELMIQFFPSSKHENTFVLSKKRIPEKIREKLNQKSDSENFFVLPNLYLKNTGECIFLENGLCGIHKVKPEQCVLFPFISLQGTTEFLEKYPFCELLKEGFEPERDSKKKSAKHYLKVKENYDKIKKEGFSSVWKNLPKKGNAFFKDEKIDEISKDEFLGLIETFK